MVQSSVPSTPRHHHAGGCSQPVLLRGRVDHIDGCTGELIHRYTTVGEPGGVLPVACKTRRASRCLPCAETYRADTYQLIRSGLSGGKGVPATVAAHPAVFLTLTAPSFGQVHARRERNGRVLACRPRRKQNICEHGRPVSCSQKHDRSDARLGEPLCSDCYDYTGTVLFNACAPELWRRFTIALHRALARHAGITAKKLRSEARISYAKVAEYQRRGIVHFHAIIRLDGADGPVTSPPAWATASALAAAVAGAIRLTSLATPAAASLPARRLSWGSEHDIRPITTSGDLTDTKVAAYVAKYATKAAECTGTLDRRIAPTDRVATLPVTGHARRLIAECLRLGQLPELEELRLAAWAHMLGFRGHFSTKSRRYSTTLTALRSARTNYQRERAIAAGRVPDVSAMTGTVLVISQWSYSGRGHPWSRSAAVLALTPDQLRPGGESRWM
jgi:hypothetical protein